MSAEIDSSHLHELLHETLAKRAMRIPNLQERFGFVAEELGHSLPLKFIVLYPENKPLENGRGICLRPEPHNDKKRELLRTREYNIIAVLRAIGISAYHPEEVSSSRDAMIEAELALDLAKQEREIRDSDMEVITYKSARATYTGRRTNAIWFASSEELERVNPQALSLDSGEFAITAAAYLFDVQP